MASVVKPRPAPSATTDPVAPATAVACADVAKTYGKTVALAGVDVACTEGEIVVLLGPSGCGKTTLLRLISGLEPPSGGRIAIHGRDMRGVEPQDRGVAFVFQDYALYPDKTVAENIEFPLRMARVPRQERRQRVAEAMRLLQIEGLERRRPAQLSGGQRQRVGIGRAIVRGPRVLLMDEPLSNLDAQLRTEMRAEILRLQRRLGMSVLYVTHDQTEALTLADTIVMLKDGHVEQGGRPHDLYARPASTFVAAFLGGMNLIAGRIADGRLHTSSGAALRAPGTGHLRGGDGVVVGVRPEELALGDPQPGEFGASGRVVLRELLGSEELLHLDVGGAALRVRVPVNGSIPDELSVRAPAGAIHLFDNDDAGRRLPDAVGAQRRT